MLFAPHLLPARERPEPLWHQAETALRSLIRDGTWADGAQLPNEDRLTEALGISRITLRHALRNMEQDGLLRREAGRGTFVRTPTMIGGIRGLTSFTDEMKGLGLTARSHILSCTLDKADARTADALDLALEAPVVRLHRLRLGNNQPVGVQRAFIPLARAPGFFEKPFDGASLYAFLGTHWGIRPREAHEVYRVGLTTQEDSALLDLSEGTPAFVVERVTQDAQGPFEFALSVMRADRYEIRSRLTL